MRNHRVYKEMNSKMKSTKDCRTQTASTLVELVCAMIVIVPLALLAINFGFLCLGSFVNNSACREAARLAAQQTSLIPALGVAKTAVKSFAIAGGTISSPQVAGVLYNFQTDSDGNPIQLTALEPSNMTAAPNVQVVTQLIVETPAPMLITGNGLAKKVELRGSQTFPILNGIDPSANDDSDSPGEEDDIPGSSDDGVVEETESDD
jgi:hypothetical protein